MNRIEHLFCILAEESAEVAQRASKIMRFGVKEVQPGQDKDNAERLIDEYTDLKALFEMLEDENILRVHHNGIHKQAKKDKVEKFLEYSKEQGTLE